MEISQHIAAIDRDAELMAVAARRAGLDAAVPGCAPWQVRDLLKHQGYVHRWATAYVAEQHAERVPRLSEPDLLAAGPADEDLLDWFSAGQQALTHTLRTADPAVGCWYFLPAPSPLAFWARRHAHETAIHRADAQLASGDPVTAFPADFAADGIDELIMGFFGRDTATGLAGQRTLHVIAEDAGADWLVALTPGGTQAAHVERGGARAGGARAGDARAGDDSADATVTGPASAVYLLLWNRSPAGGRGLSVTGDADLLKSWQDGMHITWG
jgi:uncharacterized protein (TIGR03083 family)